MSVLSVTHISQRTDARARTDSAAVRVDISADRSTSISASDVDLYSAACTKASCRLSRTVPGVRISARAAFSLLQSSVADYIHSHRYRPTRWLTVNPLVGTLKLQNNGPLHSNTAIGTLAVDGWAVTFGIARRGLSGLWPRPVPPGCTKCNSPPINGQCTNFILFDVSL